MSSEFERLQQALPKRYTLIEELDRGGMSRVYLAREELPERLVAIKVLDEELSARLGRERFVREVEVTSQLGHPYIVPLLAAGDADGTLYYAMPFIEGDSLRSRLERESRLPIEDAVRIALEVADALRHAHENGVVHRDVKPSNILFHSGHAVVADFGIARALRAAEGGEFTQSGLPIGTPDYMSPEQIDSGSLVDPRTDVYGLACVLFEMIGGHPPFLSRSPQATMARHLADPVPSLRALRDSVPASVEKVIRQALSKVPADRHPTANDFAHALRRASQSHTEEAAATPRHSPAMTAFGVSLRLAGTLLVVGALGFAWQAWSSQDPTPVLAESRYADSVAVMPFDNRTQDESLEHIGQSVADEIIRHLGSVGALRVTDSYSVVSLWPQNLGTPRLLDTLNVGHLMTGYYQLRGDQLVVNVTDSDEGGAVRPFSPFQIPLVDLASGQLQIAHAVAEAFLARIGIVATLDQEDEEYGPGRSAYLTAKEWIGQRTPEAMTRAVTHFQESIALEPDHAAAYAGLSSAYALSVNYKYDLGMTSYELASRSLAAANTAIRLDPTFASGYSSRGYILALLGLDIDQAEADFDTAQSLAPNGPNGLSWSARILAQRGRVPEAYEKARAAVALDPVAAGRRLAVASLAFQMDNYEATIEESRAALQHEPAMVFATAAQGRALALLGRGDECLDLDLGVYDAVRAICLQSIGQEEDARAVATQAASSLDAGGMANSLYSGEVVAADLAAYYGYVGDAEEALHWIDVAFELSPAGVDVRILDSALFQPLGDDEAFRTELARIRQDARARMNYQRTESG